MKSTGHDKVHVSVCLTEKADWSKCKPLIVFKGPKRESKFLHKEFKQRCSVANSTNRWMNEGLTLHWRSKVWGRFYFR